MTRDLELSFRDVALQNKKITIKRAKSGLTLPVIRSVANSMILGGVVTSDQNGYKLYSLTNARYVETQYVDIVE